MFPLFSPFLWLCVSLDARGTRSTHSTCQPCSFISRTLTNGETRGKVHKPDGKRGLESQRACANGNHPLPLNQKKWPRSNPSLLPRQHVGWPCKDARGSNIPTHCDRCRQRFPQATAYGGRCESPNSPLPRAANCPVPSAGTTASHLCTQDLQTPFLLIFLIARDEPAAGTGARLCLPLTLCLLATNGPDTAQRGSCRKILALPDAEQAPHKFPLI